MASSDPRRAQKSIPWWALTMAAALCVAVLAFAVRSGSTAHAPGEAAAIVPEGAPSTGVVRAAGERAPSAPESLATASASVSIEMYSAAWCSACSRAKAWMREQGITYHEVDVDQRSGAMAQLQVLNPRRTLPTFDVQGQVLVGFEPDRLATAIRGAARN
jgi:glutaredoxin